MHFWFHQVVLAPGCPVVPLSQASLWPCLGEVEVSFWLCRTLAVIPVWVSHAFCILWLQAVFHHSLHWCLLGVVCLSQVAQIFCRIAQLLVVVAYTCFRSTQHHMLVIPEASVDDHHGPQLIFPFNWGLPSSVQIKDDITVLSAPVSTCIFILWSFTVMYSHVTDMLNTFSRV